MNQNSVFISYAREDIAMAERLYMDLRKQDINAWLDTKVLLPGQDWQREIRVAIKDAALFVVLISESSVSKRGVVQREVRMALDVLNDVPPDKIFVIPARIDNTFPKHDRLNDLNWVDLFPSYSKGFARIMSVLGTIKKEPLELRKGGDIGSRAPIHYAPFKSFSDFVRDFVQKLPTDAMYADPEFAIFMKYDTTMDGVVLPMSLKSTYPAEITIVLQHQYKDLNSDETEISVRLVFDQKGHTLKIPHAAIIEIAVPAIGVLLKNTA